LFQVVDIESWNAVAIGCSMVQKLAHRYECHVEKSLRVKDSWSSGFAASMGQMKTNAALDVTGL
jgi:hypothetical protein